MKTSCCCCAMLQPSTATSTSAGVVSLEVGDLDNESVADVSAGNPSWVIQNNALGLQLTATCNFFQNPPNILSQI